MAEKEATARQVEEIEPENGDGKRERSTIEFPYLDLDAAVEIAKGVHQVGGTSCGWDQLAAQLGQAAMGGGFRLRVMTAKTFGLVNYGQGTVTLTELGKRLCDPQQEKAAKVDAFLAVPLYNAIYEKFKNGTLPPADALEAEIAKMGVAPKQKGKARQAFQRSATSAGFFWSGPNRLVKPAIKAGARPDTQVEEEDPTDEKENEKPEKPAKKRNPLIEGLIKALPDEGSKWDLQGRRKWLLAALSNFDLIYTDSDDGKGTLKIEVEKSSAK